MVNIVAYFVTLFYFTGLLLPGSILSFIVRLMDGLDGKLVRARNQTTNLGKILHKDSGDAVPVILCLFSIIFIYFFYRYCYDIFGGVMNMSLDIYGNFEKIFRRIVGRRNLYNIHVLLGVLLNVPLYALLSIMIHAALTAAIYAWRTVKHLRTSDRAPPNLKNHLARNYLGRSLWFNYYCNFCHNCLTNLSHAPLTPFIVRPD